MSTIAASEIPLGVHLDMPATRYHRLPGASASILRTLWQSTPAHLRVYLDGEREVTPAMILGTLAHHAILEPDRPLPKLVVPPEVYPCPPDSSLVKSRKAAPGDPVPWSWAAKFCKQWRQAQEDLGNIVVSQDVYDGTFGTALSIARHEIAGPIFARGRNEVTLVTMDEEHGIPVRCRLDHVPEGPFLGDVKVTHDVTDRGFIRNAYDSGYHIQAAIYLDVWNALCGDSDPKEGFKFVAVESRKPWAVNVFDATPEFLGRGRRDYLNALSTFARCLRENRWPAYPSIEIPLSLPAFAR